MIAILRRTVVLALLAAWSFPAAGFAKGNESSDPAPIAAQTSGRALAAGAASSASSSAQYAAREKQAQGLENFKGGEGTYIYIGGGALTVILIVLLILVIL